MIIEDAQRQSDERLTGYLWNGRVTKASRQLQSSPPRENTLNCSLQWSAKTFELALLQQKQACVWSVWGENISCFCGGIFIEWKYPYTKTKNICSSLDWSNADLFLFLFHTTHNEITQIGIVIHNKRGSWQHYYALWCHHMYIQQRHCSL